MTIKVNKSASQGFLDDMNKWKSGKGASDPIDIALFRIGNIVGFKARKYAPYKEGNLRRGINVGPVKTVRNKKSITVGVSDIIYARIQDLGGMAGRGKSVKIPKYRGRGYLTPSFEETMEKDVQKVIHEEFSKNFF